MIHVSKEHNAEFDADVKIERYMIADEKGRALVQHIELVDSVYVNHTEAFASMKLGVSRSPHWVPQAMAVDGSQVIVMFENGRFIGVPLTNCRFVEFCTDTKRDESALNLAKARAAKAAKRESKE